MKGLLCRLLFILLLPGAAHALGPHELLLLVNDDSPRSVELANHYAHLRQIPPANIVHLDLPFTATDPSSRMTREEFTRTIWEPAQAALRERRIADHILAWVYSADFPVLITGDPELSLTGITFLRNQIPESDLIRRGAYTSRLFAGPGRDLKQRGPPRSLEQYAMALMSNMPLPAMVLAHTGARGETVEQARRRLEDSLQRQGLPLPGQVFFLTSDDVRSTCRSWQFADAAAELKGLGQSAQILPLTSATPASPAWGIMAGVALPDPALLPQLLPGSIGEHLTSFAAIFNGHTYQTKMTAWLQAGAAGTAGTVTEPMSIWTKFPCARLFVHYASGCTLLESFTQSVASPLQLVTLGDPLLAPWAKPQGITLINLNDQTEGVRGAMEFAASIWAAPLDRDAHVFFLLDGRTVIASGTPPVVKIDTTALSDGYHEVRAIAYSGGYVRHQGFTRQGFTVANHGRSLRILNLSSNQNLQADQPIHLAVEVQGSPRELALVHHEQVLDRKPYGETEGYTLDPARLGAGPASLQLAAIFDDGEMVRSTPMAVNIQHGTGRAMNSFTPGLTWRPLELDSSPANGSFSTTGDVTVLKANGGWMLARALGADDEARMVSVQMQVPQGEKSLASQSAGLLFDVRDEKNFGFLGWHGENGAWGLGRVVDGKWTPTVEWGATLAAGQYSELRIERMESGGLKAVVDGLPIGTSTALEMRGPYAVGTGAEPAHFRRLGLLEHVSSSVPR